MAVSRGRGGRGRGGGGKGGARGGGGGGRGGAGWSRGTSQARREEQEIADLEARIAHGAPPRGSNPLAVDAPASSASGAEGAGNPPKGSPSPGKALKRKGPEKGEEEAEEDTRTKPYVGAKLFADMPLSERTQRGLRESRFRAMTAIQRAALPHALCGRDILGAAKTGSGKTLAFLIPLLEKLHRMKWTHADGVGAIVISPTRELASQIFYELNKVGRHHGFSGGLLIGGRQGVESEKERAGSLNILVATPGRLLQHMDETPNFDCSQLQVLVLDEADRILDLGFAASLNAILANLPSAHRQTLLFSATQTKSVRDLARLSLQAPEYVAVHADAASSTPARLQQTVMVVPLDRKMDVLWGFLKTHTQSKILVFLSSCKQVKFVYEALRRLRPGLPLKLLHGRMKQMPRLAVFHDFCDATHAALFATDVAARGLDFPAVDWVVQVDCPDDVASYIHRVGRTARYTASGRSLLLLTPSERAMLPLLEAAKIPFHLTKANPAKVTPTAPALAGLLSKDPDLKYLAQRAFVTYVRSIHVQANKEVFDVASLPAAEYAASLGLPTAPRIRFLKKGAKGHADSGEGDGKEGGLLKVGGPNEGRWSGTKISFKDGEEEEEEEEEGGEGNESEEGEGRESEEEGGRGRDDARRGAEGVEGAAGGSGRRGGSKRGAGSAGGSESEEEEEEEGEGDLGLFTPRRKASLLDDEEDQGGPAGTGRAQDAARPEVKLSRKQMKKLKARPGKLAGTRVVFDEDGTALMPLEALAREQQREQQMQSGAVSSGSGSGGGEGGGGTVDGASLARAEERFRALRAELKERDVEDKALLRQRLRERRLKSKMKLRAAEAGEGGPADMPRLARSRGEEGEEGESSGEGEYEERRGRNGGESSGEASEEEGSEGGWEGAGNGAQGMLHESSDDGEEGAGEQRKKARGAGSESRTKKQRVVAGSAIKGGPASVSERESLVLKLLAARQGKTG